MPDGMPGIVSKGRILRALDAVLENRTKRAEFHTRLTSKEPSGAFSETLIEIVSDSNLFDLSQREIKHLQEDWFALKGSYWPRHQPTEIVVRLGLAQAIDIARRPEPNHEDRPIDFFWVCTGDAIKVTACGGPAQITVMLLTPPPPVSDRIPRTFEGWTKKEKIFTARPRSRGPGEHQTSVDQDYVEFVQPLREG
jgi:hypothetical protein